MNLYAETAWCNENWMLQIGERAREKERESRRERESKGGCGRDVYNEGIVLMKSNFYVKRQMNDTSSSIAYDGTHNLVWWKNIETKWLALAGAAACCCLSNARVQRDHWSVC